MALHGREAELAALDEALANARGGRGRAVFVTGEAGIGKSSLLAEARARASGPALEGAAWESGGAPPYWPWIQVLRAAADRFGPRVQQLPGAAAIGALVSAWAPAADNRDVVGALIADTGAARFALLDAVVRAIITLAAEQPLVILLDDLHAADLPSLELLDLLNRELPRAAIAVVGGWREAELATRGDDAAKRLARASRGAAVFPLRPLNAAEVTRWVGANGAAIHATTEGNPLFVEEMLRARRSDVPPAAIATVLEDHLALVSVATRAVLASASVLGRELDPALLGVVVELDADQIDAALREATAAGLGEARGMRWAFHHVLLRDHLYAALTPSRRAALHRAAGEAIERSGTSTTGAAHHLLAGLTLGDRADDLGRAVASARAAAARAIEVFACEDAAALLAAAIRVLDAAPHADSGDRIDVRLELARARQGAGSIEAGQAEALRAAELARASGDAERLARAALVYAAELASGRRDPVMVDLLEEALASLPATDGALRARVMVRLGAALVPALDPHDLRPDELAAEAVLIAERVGDDDTRLFCQRFASHAFGFRRNVRDTLPIVHDVLAMADRLGRPLETLEQRSWLVNAHLTLGDLAASDDAAAKLIALLARVPQPHYRWRVPIMRATRATMRGDYDEAERLIATAREIAREHEIDRARLCCAFAGVSVALASRSPARAAAIVDEVRVTGRLVGGGIGDAMTASVLAIAGRHDEARVLLSTFSFLPPIGLIQMVAEPALVLGDRAMTARAIAALELAVPGAALAYGPSMSLVLCPIEVVIGEGYLLLDRATEAIGPLERGLALSRELAAPPYIVRATAALANALASRGLAADQARIRTLRGESARAPATTVPTSFAVSSPRALLDITIADDRVDIRWDAQMFSVPASKGLVYLAALIRRPHGELHVSDLIGDDDRGDAGEVIDAAARSAYKQRAEELHEQLDEARARNDLGRIDRLTAELDAITEQLLAGTGLGGRARRAGSRTERARVNVQRRIRDAIRRLGSERESLGRYLDATIRTGTFCSFAPLES